jgi:hypothetical protein
MPKPAASKRRFGLSAHKSKRRAQRAPRIFCVKHFCGGLAGRAVHEEQHGNVHEHCAWHCRRGDCQRLSYFGIVLGGWIGYLICGFIGAALLIWIVRVIRPA